jgi:hypothetical protein
LILDKVVPDIKSTATEPEQRELVPLIQIHELGGNGQLSYEDRLKRALSQLKELGALPEEYNQKPEVVTPTT